MHKPRRFMRLIAKYRDKNKLLGLKGNLFNKIPRHIKKEMFEVLVKRPGLSIKRILTQGQTTDWLKQDTDEWVVLLAGSAKLLFEDGNRQVSMKPGEYVQIPARCRHRVSWTDPRQKSVWLAVHYKE
jgi:cupin 2 domain-containing protein